MKAMSNLKVLVAKFDQVDSDPEFNFRETLFVENGRFRMVTYAGCPLVHWPPTGKEIGCDGTEYFDDIEIAQNWFKMRFGEEMSGHLLFAIKQTIKAHLLALS
jgi:hypothetical protein